MYVVTLEQDVLEMLFQFEDSAEALAFAESASNHGLPYTTNLGRKYDMNVSIKIEKCAEGGNPEMAHIENQEQNSTD